MPYHYYHIITYATYQVPYHRSSTISLHSRQYQIFHSTKIEIIKFYANKISYTNIYIMEAIHIEKHTITIKTLNNSTMIGTYNPNKTTLRQVINTIFNNYECRDFSRERIDIISKTFEMSVFNLDQSLSMSDLGFGTTKNTIFCLKVKPDEEAEIMKAIDNKIEDELTKKLLRRIGGGMQILCKALTGKSICMNVEPSLTIADVKLLIRYTEGIPRNSQKLVYKGIQLQDDCTLEEYGIKRESTLHLILNLRGGMFAESSGRNGKYGCLESHMFDVESDLV